MSVSATVGDNVTVTCIYGGEYFLTFRFVTNYLSVSFATDMFTLSTVYNAECYID